MAARVTGRWLTSKAESLEKCSKERKTRAELGLFQPKISVMKGLYFYFICGYLVKNKIWHPTIPLVSKKCLLGRYCCCPSSRTLLFSARARMSGSVLCNKTRAMDCQWTCQCQRVKSHGAPCLDKDLQAGY